RAGGAGLGHAIARIVRPRPGRSLHLAGTAGSCTPGGAVADGPPARLAHGSGQGRFRRGTGKSGARAARARRTDAALSQPARLRTGTGLLVMRLVERLPALHRSPGGASGRTPPALSPLRLRRAGAAQLPRM